MFKPIVSSAKNERNFSLSLPTKEPDIVFWTLDFFHPLGRIKWLLLTEVEITSGNLKVCAVCFIWPKKYFKRLWIRYPYFKKTNKQILCKKNPNVWSLLKKKDLVNFSLISLWQQTELNYSCKLRQGCSSQFATVPSRPKYILWAHSIERRGI